MPFEASLYRRVPGIAAKVKRAAAAGARQMSAILPMRHLLDEPAVLVYGVIDGIGGAHSGEVPAAGPTTRPTGLGQGRNVTDRHDMAKMSHDH